MQKDFKPNRKKNNTGYPYPNRGILKVFYILMYFIPGLLVYVMINIKPVYDHMVQCFGIRGEVLQLIIFFFITYGWHIVLPIYMLRYAEGKKWQEVWQYLGMNKIDYKGLILWLPIFFILTVLISYPYLIYIGRPLRQIIDTIPQLSIPEYSLFSSYEGLYNWPILVIVLMLLGNLVGEELYFRSYLMKKTEFLGIHNAWVNGVFFAVYHFWQAPQTWPLFGISILFSLLMYWRKNLYVVIIFHGLLNFLWPLAYNWLFKSYPFF